MATPPAAQTQPPYTTTVPADGADPHPEAMIGDIDLRIGDTIAIRAHGRITPAGLAAAGLTAAGMLLALAGLIRALRRPV
ncbi:MAG: hypothetical protein J0H79_01230 [Alphaproteobacteria bacterium]|nr:hypothetical protein [Alphaproteobacteria bacterium]